MTPEPATLESQTTTLINYVEIWTLPELADADNVSQEANRLKLDSAFAMELDGVRTVEPSVSSIEKGHGIAGSAWQQGGAVIMQGEPKSAVIESIARDSSMPIHALLSIPVYRDFVLVNVVVLGLAEGHGGLEIWTRDDRDELSISGSYYAGLPSFEFISQYVRFPKGAGLPGACWKASRPKMVEHPATNPNFIRSFDRDPSSLSRGIAVPISREYGFPASVLLMLSDTDLPLARHIDIWECDSDASRESAAALSVKATANPLMGADSDWQQAACDTVAVTQSSYLLAGNHAAIPDGYRGGLFLPFFTETKITDMLVMLF